MMSLGDIVQSNNGAIERAFQVHCIRAIALTVADLKRSEDFYVSALGFKVISEVTVEGQECSDLEAVEQAHITIATLQLGAEQIQLMQYLNCDSQPIPRDSQSTDLWFQHFAIVVSDFDRAYDHLRSFTFESISNAPQTLPMDIPEATGVRAFKFKDPDGHNLELIWFPPDKRQPQWNSVEERLFLGIDHSAIAVANTERSLHFYRDLLGMQVESSSLHRGEIQALLDGLPEATVQVTGLRPIESGMGIELLDYSVPANGRQTPPNWRSCDIAHLQVELVVNQIEQGLEMLNQKGVQIVSSRLVSFAADAPYRQGCLVKDPDGHAMLLITL
jgi:catechol 2,3-dioxygenase-like lactoylglutathione lyase family enzyme